MKTQAARELVDEFRQLKARRAERLERMRECLAGFGEVYRAAHPPPVRRPLPERMAAMGEAVHTFADLRERVRAERPADFSILGVLRKQHDELTHTCLLAWLLDPRGDHEQGALFLSAFASLIGLQAASESLRRCRVRTECTGPEARIDIMVWRVGDFLVFIENKVWSPEGEEQVDREFRDLRYTGTTMGVSPDRQFAVFLTPSGGPPISGDPSPWICVSYGELRECLGATVSQITDAKVHMLVEDWLEVTSDWG